MTHTPEDMDDEAKRTASLFSAIEDAVYATCLKAEPRADPAGQLAYNVAGDVVEMVKEHMRSLHTALACEEAYSHARSSNDWMATLTEAGWDGKSNPRPFINALRRAALSRLDAASKEVGRG